MPAIHFRLTQFRGGATVIYEGMIAEMVAVEGDGGLAIPAYVARPLRPGPFTGVVLVHHLPG